MAGLQYERNLPSFLTLSPHLLRIQISLGLLPDYMGEVTDVQLSLNIKYWHSVMIIELTSHFLELQVAFSK